MILLLHPGDLPWLSNLILAGMIAPWVFLAGYLVYYFVRKRLKK